MEDDRETAKEIGRRPAVTGSDGETTGGDRGIGNEGR